MRPNACSGHYVLICTECPVHVPIISACLLDSLRSLCSLSRSVLSGVGRNLATTRRNSDQYGGIGSQKIPAASKRSDRSPECERRTMQTADLDRIVAQLRSAETAYEEARRQRDDAVIALARVEGLSNREIARRVALTAERVAQILKAKPK
jgi:hypothetical protein